MTKLFRLFAMICKQGQVSQEFKAASITHQFKQKGEKALCDNHWCISLLSVTGKILTRAILNRIITHLTDYVYPKSQCAYLAGDGPHT